MTPVEGSQSEAAFAIDPRDPNVIVGVDDNVTEHVSRDGGRRWRSADDAALSGTNTHRDPRVAVDASGREYVAYLASDLPDDEVTPYLVVATRTRRGAPWRRVRVAKPAWAYGFDDAPAISTSGRRVYVAWTRSLGAHAAAVVVAASSDGGSRWSTPVVADPPQAHPHSATLAVTANGDLYVGGIDVPHGIWVARSRDGGRTFSPPSRLAPLHANPAAGDCARTGVSPVANEARTCAGPYPTLLADGDRVAVVYDDGGDVEVASLRPRFRATVNPPDGGKTQQLIPAAAADPTTGVLWACWYDTTFDPSGKSAWFTCSHSTDGGRRWSAPVRAAAVRSQLAYLDVTYAKGGLEPAVVALGGVAHAFWVDTRQQDLVNDIYTARLHE